MIEWQHFLVSEKSCSLYYTDHAQNICYTVSKTMLLSADTMLVLIWVQLITQRVMFLNLCPWKAYAHLRSTFSQLNEPTLICSCRILAVFSLRFNMLSFEIRHIDLATVLFLLATELKPYGLQANVAFVIISVIRVGA